MDDEKRQKEKIHQKSLQKIKKQITTEEIDGVLVSYSLLDKKNNSGTGTNNRLLIMYHKDKIGYVNELPKGTMLPFKTSSAIPKLKEPVILLDNIQKATDDKQLLKIVFNFNGKKGEWVFKCTPAMFAKKWANLINSSIQQRKDDKLNPPREVIVEPVQKNDPEVNKVDESNKKLVFEQKKQEKILAPQTLNENPVNSQKIPILQKQSIGSDSRVQDQNSPPKVRDSQNIQNSNEINSEAPVFGQQSQQKAKSSLKPKSSFFVGGMAVENQKDQVELKNKMASFQTITSQIKQQYNRKKQEQKQIQQQSLSSITLLNNVLSFSTNMKYQIQKMQRQWGYQFAKGQNQYEIIQKFKQYVEAVSEKIIDELGLKQKKRYYQPSDISNYWIKYEINGILFVIFMTELKQISSHVYSFAEKGTIVSNEQEKLSAHQFKNYNYILQKTQNKGKLRVPLSMINHYKGITVYAKVLIPTAQNYDKIDLVDKQLQILQVETRIHNSVFQDPEPESGRVVALQSKIYEKLARAQNINKKFDICYIEGLMYYLPHDFNNFSKDRPEQRLRAELIQDDQCQDLILRGEDMCAMSSRLKLSQQMRDGMNQLIEVSKIVLERINILVQQLESVKLYFTNSEQLSDTLHSHGINIRYLGILMERLKQTWLKQITMSQICARCAKKYLNLDLQDCLINLSESSIENVYKFQTQQIANFLNKLLGNSQDAQTFWKQLNRQSQSEYRVSINREQVNHSYLLQAIQYHCCIKLTLPQTKPNAEKPVQNKSYTLLKMGSKMGLLNNTSMSSASLIGPNMSSNNSQLFSSPFPFTTANIVSFTHRSKVYNTEFTQLYSSIKSILSQPTKESFEQLKLVLNLNRSQNVASHFRMSKYYQKIILFLAAWMPPSQAPFIYESQQIQLGDLLPSRTLYQLKIFQIKWAFASKNIELAEQIKCWVVDHVAKWLGECHPVLTQLYRTYANYYMFHKDQQKKAINYCKSAIKNQESLIGATHKKVTDNYYLLGEAYLNFGKKMQAINSFQKAKQIMIKNNSQDEESYGRLCLKMGQLFLCLQQLNDAKDSAIQSITVQQKYSDHQTYIQSVELLCRCFEVQQDWDSYWRLIEGSLIQKVPFFVESVELTERIIKLCVFPSLKQISLTNSDIAHKIVKVLSQLPDTTRAPNMAYNFLRARIEEAVFPQRFLQGLANIQQILEEIEANGMLTRWKGFQSLTNKSFLNKVGVSLQNKGFNFLANLQALNIFLGGTYLQSILLDQ